MTKTPFPVNDDARPQSSRRAVLRGLAISPVILATAAGVGLTLARAGDSDPIVGAIEAHKAARCHLNDFDSEHPQWDAALDTEGAAWDALLDTVPTTSAGLIAFVEHVVAYPDLGRLVGDVSPSRALHTIATAFRALGGANV
jgi:hypothetical protein